eukprot:scaffold121930_cov30-Tisochrysis_lutea.AAC.3
MEKRAGMRGRNQRSNTGATQLGWQCHAVTWFAVALSSSCSAPHEAVHQPPSQNPVLVGAQFPIGRHPLAPKLLHRRPDWQCEYRIGWRAFASANSS